MIPPLRWILSCIIVSSIASLEVDAADNPPDKNLRRFRAIMTAAVSEKGDFWKELASPAFEPVRPDTITPLMLPSRAWAEFQVVVRKDGRVGKIAITRQSDSFKPAAAKAAIAAIRGWTFFPATKNGKPIDWTVEINIRVMESKTPELPAYPFLQVKPRYVPELFSIKAPTVPGIIDEAKIGKRDDAPTFAKGTSNMKPRPSREGRIALPDGTVMTSRSTPSSRIKPDKTVQIIPDTVTFKIDIDEQGKITRYTVTDAPFPAFLPAAVDALLASKWSPQTSESGKPTPSTLTIPIGNWGERRISQPGFLYLFDVATHDGERVPVADRFNLSLAAYDSPVFPTALLGKKMAAKRPWICF